MPWTADPTNAALPSDADQALSAAAEIRKIKEYLTRIPVTAISANGTLAAAAAGTAEVHLSSDPTARTRTIPDNATVPFAIGTTISWFNEPGAGALFIAIAGTDVLYMSPGGGTGSRTLAAGGIATATKIAATKWMISGTGLT